SSQNLLSLYFPASVRSIGVSAFSSCVNLEQVTFEAGSRLIGIGKSAFQSCRSLSEISLPDSLEYIGERALPDTVTAVSFGPSLRELGWPVGSKLNSFTLDPDNPFFMQDSDGVLYSADGVVLIGAPLNLPASSYTVREGCTQIRYYAFAGSPLKSVVLPAGVTWIRYRAFSNAALSAIAFPDTVKTIGNYAFSGCAALKQVDFGAAPAKICNSAFEKTGLETIRFPDSITEIDSSAFSRCTSLRNAVIGRDISILHGYPFPSETVIYCYAGSDAQALCEQNQITYYLIDETEPDLSQISTLLDQAAAIERALYTAETIGVLDAAVQEAQSAADGNDQAQINSAAAALQAALNNLQYKAADETALQDALARAAAIDRSLYTDESLAALDAAAAAAPTNADITQQAQVTAAAEAISAALNSLSFRPADYSALNRLIESVQAMDLTLYSDASVAALNSAIRAVDYALNCTQQAQVDAYCSAIETAVGELQFAPVVLRHDACGVIVSGTTKELDPATLLSVQMVDPAAHEGSNFAVGGTIKHLSFYDINLLLGGQRVQPRDTVTAKIKLAEGVDPAKCKVYHVTDDLVNPLVRFTSTIDGNYIVFETDHFSEFAVIEVEAVADSISVTQLPSKTVYTLGEAFDPAGLRVTLHYSDGANADVADYDLSAVSMDTIGSRTVTVYYTVNGKTLSAQFSITVISPGNSYQLNLRQPSVTALRYGETLMLYTVGDLPRGASVKWTYDGKGLKLTPTEDTKCCAVYSNGTGEGNVTAYVVDAAGNTLTDANGKPVSASVRLTSNGSFLQRVISFFKNLFHVDRRIDY
ncbi:MAG: leucine-rich repeat protein, partial [Clostridia bacterium]|nr:leucine-rich repeat protein [Clostridia bacterium]